MSARAPDGAVRELSRGSVRPRHRCGVGRGDRASRPHPRRRAHGGSATVLII